ncbi:RimJ/RimL family protein N-acetyltransferase [Psychromicrobium silvestre]|uniref:RimJ/RimL family protein N-acetyltransferase n=1 Tax=Psychromicrobium silvestre TaxID=1645614 RepID=A0A7Y9LTY5_9MICC|nr:GNAT family protein [Psychromicrobium silvestre]NYE95521.1 RimJ/RimL family protein N-acetyltransferase [Psychromicrobium silvestre]
MQPFLRAWQPEDAEALIAAFLASDMASQGGPLDALEAARWIETRRWGASKVIRSLAVDLAGVAVGGVTLSGIETVHNTAWMSYWAAPEARGRGLTTRAVATLADWAFGNLDVFRLELGHRLNNPGSGKVATGAGFVPEGLERQKLRYDDQRFDVVTYSRLRADPAPEVDLLPLKLVGGV